MGKPDKGHRPDEDGYCVMSGLEPPACAGCLGQDQSAAAGDSLARSAPARPATWRDVLGPDDLL